ncbi:hypothetical protein I4U23_022466 [Adineta vaga]|nr:hypothetical protein I4U23_022466 [Adineta vaga]
MFDQTAKGTRVSYNQPKLSGCSQWDPRGITFAEGTVVGSEPLDVFVDRNNTVYVVDLSKKEVHAWGVNSTTPTTIILNHFIFPWGLFVTIDGDIYVGGDANGNVKKWAPNATNGILVMNINTKLRSNNASIIQSKYSSALTENSQTFMPIGCGTPTHHYKAIQVDVIETGCYNLVSNSTIATYGYIYKDDFIPINPTVNLFLQTDRNYRSNQFEFQTHLLVNINYILVVKTFDPAVTGVFSVLITGPNNVSFTSIGECT